MSQSTDQIVTSLLGTSAEDMRGSLNLMKPTDVLVVGAALLQRLEATGNDRLTHRKNTATAMRKALKQLESGNGGAAQ